MRKRLIFIGGLIVVAIVLIILIIDTPSSAYGKVMESIKDSDKIFITARYSFQSDTEVMLEDEILEDYTIEITDEDIISDIVEILSKSKYEMRLSDVVTVVSDDGVLAGYDMEFYVSDKLITSITIKTGEIDTTKYVGKYSSSDDYDTLKELIESQNT